jgi:hypothetical protein
MGAGPDARRFSFGAARLFAGRPFYYPELFCAAVHCQWWSKKEVVMAAKVLKMTTVTAAVLAGSIALALAQAGGGGGAGAGGAGAAGGASAGGAGGSSDVRSSPRPITQAPHRVRHHARVQKRAPAKVTTKRKAPATGFAAAPAPTASVPGSEMLKPPPKVAPIFPYTPPAKK